MKSSDIIVSLIITSTITPFKSTNVVLQDPKIRANQYFNSFRYALDNYPVNKIVLCENSDYDLSQFSDLSLNKNPRHIACEFLTQNDIDRNAYQNIGAYEMDMLLFAFENSKYLTDSNFVLKLTGRHYSPSVPQLVSFLQRNPRLSILSNLTCGLSYSDSRCFAGSPEFFINYLFPLKHLFISEENIWFENILARAINRAVGDGLIWSLPPRPVIIIGQSGSKGLSYRTDIIYNLLRFTRHKMKLIAYGQNPKLIK